MSRKEFAERVNRVNEAKAGSPPRPLIRPRRAYIQEKSKYPKHVFGIAFVGTIMTYAVFNGGFSESDRHSLGVTAQQALMAQPEVERAAFEAPVDHARVPVETFFPEPKDGWIRVDLTQSKLSPLSDPQVESTAAEIDLGGVIYRTVARRDGTTGHLDQRASEVLLELFIRPADRPLGPPDKPKVWAETLSERLSNAPGKAGKPWWFKGFVGAMSVTDDPSVPYFKFKDPGRQIMEHNMVLALNHRTELRIMGEIRPSALKALIQGIDLDALHKRVEATQ
jgi:hypothetical protein